MSQALFRIESGGRWDALGPVITRPGAGIYRGDRAYGIGQVMGKNIPSWTQKHYGRSLTPQEYLRNKDAQIAVLNGELASYRKIAARKTSDPDIQVRMIAAAWFGGVSSMDNYASTTAGDGYTSMNKYTSTVLTDYRKISPSQAAPESGVSPSASDSDYPFGDYDENDRVRDLDELTLPERMDDRDLDERTVQDRVRDLDERTVQDRVVDFINPYIGLTDEFPQREGYFTKPYITRKRRRRGPQS